MRTKLTLGCASMLILLASCQKEISSDILGNTASGSLAGTWKFVRLHGNTSVTQEVMDAGSDVKTVTISDYTTINNQGSYTFGDTSFTMNNVAYDISTVAKAYTYENGNLDDSTDFPFNFSVPAVSGSGSYKRINSDSLSFSSVMLPVSGMAGSVSPAPGGGRYSIVGDTLTISGTIHQVYTDNSMGIPIVVTEDAVSNVTLAKQ